MDKPIKKEKKFIIILHSGERFETKFESKEKVISWLSTGAAGFLPLRSNEFIRLNPEKIKEIIEIKDE